MPNNVFEGLDEIIERQKKAAQDAEKHTNDILTALSQSNQVNATVKKEKLSESNKPRTLVEQLANDDPAVIEFVKNAKRVWRYHGEHSDFNRNLEKVKKRGIIYLLLLSLQLTLPFLLVSATPYAWILEMVSKKLLIQVHGFEERTSVWIPAPPLN